MNNNLSTILEPLSVELSAVRRTIELLLTTDISLINQGALHLFKTGGKMIRGTLVLLMAGINGDVPQGTVQVAAAAEICHAATLIHDDIIDQSFLRRGETTVSEKMGNKVGVLVGDLMYTQALDTIVQDKNPLLFPVITAGTRDMVQGELYQLQYSNYENISLEHYYSIIELKTARFMAACAKLGALKAGLSLEECNNFYDFGLEIGMAFQVVDDTLDYLSTEEHTGKDAVNDFVDGKITLPFLHLMEKDLQEADNLYYRYQENKSRENWANIARAVKDVGGIERANGVAHDYIDRARSRLTSFQNDKYKSILLEITDFFLDRTY